MPLITDFHMHSKYSRACSKTLDLPHLHAWAQLKGVDLLSAGDFTHPKWFAELHEQLVEVKSGGREQGPSADASGLGFYELREEFKLPVEGDETIKAPRIPEKCRRGPMGARGDVRFFLATEISLIYKKNGRVRKIHHLIVAPNLATAARINIELEKRGNIRSDGRPILGLDSKVLLQLLLDISPDILLIPAHIWTPHFAILGSNSGFDTIEECFEELTPHIVALETGLSSDPAMNWRLSQLDRYVMVSSSDAHSPQKMGREATILDIEPTYPALLQALQQDRSKVVGTLEFFPEEGKYHADGLRAEGLCLLPDETVAHGYVSPQTGNKITVGVLHRVNKLADRPVGYVPDFAGAEAAGLREGRFGARPFWNIIPLMEIVAEMLDMTVASKKVEALYFSLLEALGPEFYILREAPIKDIAAVNERLAEAILRMREGRVTVKPGYDGEYGVIRVFEEDELKRREQGMLF